MLIAKWGNSLAIRIPARLVDEMRLKEGDDVELVAGVGDLYLYRAMAEQEKWDRFFAECDKHPLVDDDYVFDRDEANAR